MGELIAQIPERVDASAACRDARQNSDRENARVEHDRALASVTTEMLRCSAELHKASTEQDGFRFTYGG